MIKLLFLLLPVNLGWHYITTEFYVRGKLVDYLVPVLWAQDLIILAIFLEERKIGNRWLIAFLAVFLPSVILAERLIPAVYFFARLVLYVFLAFYVSKKINPEKEFANLVKILSFSVIFISILGIAQWFKQASIFDNYLFFGEQPYDITTFNIARTTDFAGKLKIPAYGTFRHPNVFGGFLAVVVFWAFALIRLGKGNTIYKWAFLIGLTALTLTFSLNALITLFVGMVIFVVIQRFGKKGVLLGFLVTFAFFALGLFLPLFKNVGGLDKDPSFYRRSLLLEKSYEAMEKSPAFGIGLNGFTVEMQDYFFNQPVHNVFALIMVESGIFALIAVFILLLVCVFGLLKFGFGIPAVFFVSILQFIILGSFDHYIYTIHQTQILFWLTIGLCLSYTKNDAQIQN